MRSPILTAIFHPLNIVMMGLAVFAGLFSAWWLFFVGVVLWGVMVVGVAKDRSLHINYEIQQRAPLAQRFQTQFKRIERAQIDIFNSIDPAPSRTRKVLQPVQDAANALTNKAHALCQRMTAMENYRVVSQSQTDLSTDLAHLEGIIELTDDAVVRREYEASRLAMQDRLAKLETAEKQLARVEAQLVSVANEMESIVAEVVRLQALGPESASAYTPELLTRLRQETAHLKAFDAEATV